MYGAWMGRALQLASQAARAGDVPVGAVVVGPSSEDPRAENVILGEGWNTREVSHDPTGHAEMAALRGAAARRGAWRLDDCTLVVTLEPCPMCAGAASQARIARIVLGAWAPKAGACGSVWDIARDSAAPHRIEVVGGVREGECAATLRAFFEARR